MSSTPFRLAAAAALALSAWSAPVLAAGAQVTLVATPNPATQGSTVDVDVLISQVTDLYAYQFSISFNPTLLQVSGLAMGSFLSVGGATFSNTGTIDNTAGTVTFVYNSLVGALPGVSGSGTLLTLHLNAIGTGTSALGFVPDDTLFVDSNITPIGLTTVDSSLQVAAAVPEPESYLMLAVGLAGLALWRRRQAAA